MRFSVSANVAIHPSSCSASVCTRARACARPCYVCLGVCARKVANYTLKRAKGHEATWVSVAIRSMPMRSFLDLEMPTDKEAFYEYKHASTTAMRARACVGVCAHPRACVRVSKRYIANQ
jgi:hypothetical protein